MRLTLLGSALSPDFVTEGRSPVLLGKPGRGKTHLATAIAYRAIQNGFEALFVTAAANMLFRVANDRHKRKRSMIFTTNKPLAAWGAVLHDEDLA